MVDDKFTNADDSLCGGYVAIALGMRLRTLSIWHMWLLRNMGNPYAVGGTADGASLCELVMVCSMDRREFAKYANSGADRLSEMLVGRFFLMSQEEKQEQMDVIHEYLETQTDVVEFWDSGDSDPIRDRLRCPPEWHMVLSLLKHGVCNTEEQAWDYPYARAMAWRAVINESEYQSRNYIDPLDREQIEKVNNANNH